LDISFVLVMLCMVCRTKIDTAYNDLCFDCYKKQKMEKEKASGRIRQSMA
jgi:NMD protein affecting ribosome stability and mRNA decay